MEQDMKEPQKPVNPQNLTYEPVKPNFRCIDYQIITEKFAKQHKLNSRIIFMSENADFSLDWDYEDVETNLEKIIEAVKKEGISPKDIDIDLDGSEINIKDKIWINTKKQQIIEKYNKDLAEYKKEMKPKISEYKKQLKKYLIEKAEYNLWRAKEEYNKATKTTKAC